MFNRDRLEFDVVILSKRVSFGTWALLLLRAGEEKAWPLVGTSCCRPSAAVHLLHTHHQHAPSPSAWSFCQTLVEGRTGIDRPSSSLQRKVRRGRVGERTAADPSAPHRATPRPPRPRRPLCAFRAPLLSYCEACLLTGRPQVFAQRNPRYLLRIVNRHDEFFALVMFFVERHYLKTWGEPVHAVPRLATLTQRRLTRQIGRAHV